MEWGGGGNFLVSNYFYLPSLRVVEGGGGRLAPCGWTPSPNSKYRGVSADEQNRDSSEMIGN